MTAVHLAAIVLIVQLAEKTPTFDLTDAGRLPLYDPGALSDSQLLNIVQNESDTVH